MKTGLQFQGFSLVEALVALALLNAGLVLTAQLILQSVGARAADRAQLRALRLTADLGARLSLQGTASAANPDSVLASWQQGVAADWPASSVHVTRTAGEPDTVTVELSWPNGRRSYIAYLN